jgi:hypothetical protein
VSTTGLAGPGKSISIFGVLADQKGKVFDRISG